MKKFLITLLCFSFILIYCSSVFAAESIMDFSLTNARVTDLKFSSTNIDFSNEVIQQRYGDGEFRGISFSVRAPWRVLVYLQGYKGVGTYSLSGGNQFDHATMIFSAEAGSYWPSASEPGTLEILSDDGSVITGKFHAPTSYTGKGHATDTFDGTFTVVMK